MSTAPSTRLQTTLTHIKPVSLDRFQRLLNHGPTVLVSAQCPETKKVNVMSVAWACVLDFAPKTKITIVLDRSTETRKYIENGATFAVQMPCYEQLYETDYLGTVHRYEDDEKLNKAGTEIFFHGQENNPNTPPLVVGCVAWILCELIPIPSNQDEHDLFIGKVVGAYADERAYTNDRWVTSESHFPNLRTIHHIAGGNYFITGEQHQVAGTRDEVSKVSDEDKEGEDDLESQ